MALVLIGVVFGLSLVALGCCFYIKKLNHFHTVRKLKTVVIILDLKVQEISMSYGLESWSF